MKTFSKKTGVISLSLLSIFIILFVIWYNSPASLLDISKDEVLSIYIFDGTQGRGVEITSDSDITHIIDNLNSVTIKPTKPSIGYMGYRLRIEIYTKTGGESTAVETFIVNSEHDIRKDPFFYQTVDGEIDFQYLQELLSQT